MSRKSLAVVFVCSLSLCYESYYEYEYETNAYYDAARIRVSYHSLSLFLEWGTVGR